jgi:hypothetical protein
MTIGSIATFALLLDVYVVERESLRPSPDETDVIAELAKWHKIAFQDWWDKVGMKNQHQRRLAGSPTTVTASGFIHRHQERSLRLGSRITKASYAVSSYVVSSR